MRIRTTHRIANNTYVTKSWNPNGGLIKNIFFLIVNLYILLFQVLWIVIKWFTNKIKSKKNVQ